MATLHKFFEMFRSLKSDAVPRPPRPTKDTPTNPKTERTDENNENTETNEPEEILVESDDEEAMKSKPKFKTFFKSGKKHDKPDKKSQHSSSTVNTQATGNVINVVNSKNVRWGNDYYMGPTFMKPQKKQNENEGSETEEEEVKKCNDIILVMEARIKPEHEYIDHISKNLGKKWQRIFIKLGYTKNRIETMIIDTEKYGVSEARYKLLLDWINNEEDPSLGRLATHLWNEGERPLVRDLALMYKKNIKNAF